MHFRSASVRDGALNSWGRCATRSPLCLPGDVRDRDIERSRTSVARDRQLNGVSNANVLQNVDEIGHAVHWLAVRGGDNVLNGASIALGAFQARFCGRRLRQGPQDDDAIDTQADCFVLARGDDADARHRDATVADELMRSQQRLSTSE